MDNSFFRSSLKCRGRTVRPQFGEMTLKKKEVFLQFCFSDRHFEMTVLNVLCAASTDFFEGFFYRAKKPEEINISFGG
jgi:hypothetical protein